MVAPVTSTMCNPNTLLLSCNNYKLIAVKRMSVGDHRVG